MLESGSSARWHWAILLGSVAVIVASRVLGGGQGGGRVELDGVPLPSPCGFKHCTGIACPGCGLTRSFVLGMRGDPEALAVHPVGPVLLLLVLLQVPYRIHCLLGGRWRVPERVSWALLWLLIGTLLGVWLLRLCTGSLPP